jgi:hypothetical protein
MAEIKPIGFKPDGSHVNKGALLVVVGVLIGLYCIFADAPFAWLFGTNAIEVVSPMGNMN